LATNVEEWEALLKVKVDVSIEKKNAFKIANLKATKECEIIMDAEFKARVKDLLNL